MTRARLFRNRLTAAVVAGSLSGVPSTVHAAATGRPVLGAAAAAGELLGRRSLRRGLLAHTAMTLWWTSVLHAVLPRRHGLRWGALGGLAIAGIDLAIAERRYPAIAALPGWPQVADHVVFGALVGAMIGSRRPAR